MSTDLTIIHDRATKVRASIAQIETMCTSRVHGLLFMHMLVDMQNEIYDKSKTETNPAAKVQSELIVQALALYQSEFVTQLDRKFPCEQSGKSSTDGPSFTAPPSTSTGEAPTSPEPDESGQISGPA